MNPTLLRTFVAVAELRHFARAASLCNLSQPAVSHQIALLENELGVRLLNRANRRVSLTVAGEVMLEEAQRILAAVDRARERMQEVARGAVGRIRLGASPTAGHYLLPPVLCMYRERYATYDLHFEIAAPHQIADRVARNDLDMGVLGGELPTTELQSKPLMADQYVLIASSRHALAKTKTLTPSRLISESWILREEGSETRKALAAWWHRHRLQPPKTLTFHGPDGVKHAVAANLGLAMTSKLTVREELRRGTLRELDVKSVLPHRSFSVVDHPQKHHGAACRAMLELLTTTFPRINRTPVD
ncbi:MAG TPA: LysR family transcriptional regulator [Vicinamibacterales bacterium]|nr:LysR family transcriptional regulator [Vicinamibacterales bacterium]